MLSLLSESDVADLFRDMLPRDRDECAATGLTEAGFMAAIVPTTSWTLRDDGNVVWVGGRTTNNRVWFLRTVHWRPAPRYITPLKDLLYDMPRPLHTVCLADETKSIRRSLGFIEIERKTVDGREYVVSEML